MRRNRKAKATPKGRNKDALSERAQLSELLKSISRPPKIDGMRIRKYKVTYGRLKKALSAASPNSKGDLISGIAVDLADFWEIAGEHQQRVRELAKMRFPKDQERFIDMLYEFEIRLLMHAQWHVKRLKPRLTRIKRDLGLI